MSKPVAAAASRKKDNRFNPADFADVLASKGQAAGAVTGGDRRSASMAPRRHFHQLALLRLPLRLWMMRRGRQRRRDGATRPVSIFRTT